MRGLPLSVAFCSLLNRPQSIHNSLLRLRALYGENTAIFLVSDHGIHYGKYYDNTKAGPAEHALPLFYALFPQRILAQHPAIERALCANQRRLVSPFDLHATLLGILSHPMPPTLPDWSSVTAGVRPRSLLKEVPVTRTCDEAGVPPEACPSKWTSCAPH